MKIKITILILTLCAFISSCQSTPEELIVQQKDAEKLEEIINEVQILDTTAVPVLDNTPNNRMKYEDNYIYLEWQDNISWSNAKSNTEIIVNIDADICYPSEITYPVLKVEERSFTIDDAAKAKDYFFGDKDIYIDLGHKTKYDYLDDICRFKSMIENIKNRTDLTESQKQAQIKDYEELIEAIQVRKDSAPTSTASDKVETMQFTKASSSADDAQIIKVCTSDDTQRQKFTVLNVPSDKIYYMEWYISGMPYFGQEAEIDLKTNYALLYDYYEAAQSVLDGLSIDYMSLAGVSAISNGAEIKLDNKKLRENDIDNSCFVFHYMRNVNGIPTVYSQEIDGILKDEGTEKFAPFYFGEIIDITIDKQGIIKFEWKSPADIVSVENSNVKVLELDKIKDIFKQQIFVSKVWTFDNSKKTIYIDRVEYGMARVPIKNNKSEYRYVPSWTFFGHEELITYTADGEEMLTISVPFGSYMTINAIDGTIID